MRSCCIQHAFGIWVIGHEHVTWDNVSIRNRLRCQNDIRVPGMVGSEVKLTRRLQVTILSSRLAATGPAMQDFDEWLGLKFPGLDVAGLRNNSKLIGFGDPGRLLTRPSQILGERGQHGCWHH